MIQVVSLPPPVILATTDEAAPASVSLPPTIPILTTELTRQLLPAFLHNMQNQALLAPARTVTVRQCGQSCPNQHPSMCFKFLRYGTRGCNTLDCNYSHPNMCKTHLTTGRCDREKKLNLVNQVHTPIYSFMLLNIARLFTKANPKFKL